MKSATRERTLLRIAKVDQARTTSFDVVGQNPFSRMVMLVFTFIVLKRLHIMERMRKTVMASIFFPLSKRVSNPPVVEEVVVASRSKTILKGS